MQYIPDLAQHRQILYNYRDGDSMAWVISFVISWILFFALIDFKKLKYNYKAGLAAIIIGSMVDYGGQKLKLYEFYDIIIPWFNCSAFYKFGPIFTMGVLFAQYMPRGKWMQALNIVVCSTLYMMLEISIVRSGTAQYIHWSYYASYAVDLLTFSALSWFVSTFIRSKPETQ